jgi:hypothetical protein
VWATDGVYKWSVEVITFTHVRTVIYGTDDDALSACLSAERCCEEQRLQLWKPWMDDAIEAGWRSLGS